MKKFTEEVITGLRSKLAMAKPQNIRPLDGFFDTRIDIFLRSDTSDIEIKLLPDKAKSMNIFQVICMQPGLWVDSFIVAHHRSKGILWLDNHGDNSDYNTFISREALHSFYPNNATALANLLLDTKFAYLMKPRLISHVLDIPSLSSQKRMLIKEAMQESEIVEFDLFSQEQLARIQAVEKFVKPPAFQIVSTTSINLNFTVWTRLNGFLLNISCHFRDNQLEDDISILEKTVGDFYLMR